MADKRWVSEALFDEMGFRISYRVDRVLHETRTKHQDLILFRNKYFGKVLMLDGATQVTSRDEFVYHEMMSHVPLFAHGSPREVLIVGGGDCGIAEEVLKHKSVKRLTQVEIDASVVKFSRKHFPEFTGPVLKDKRFDLIIDDGVKFVSQTERRFDVIIIDSTDPQGPGRVLFSRRFYAGCRRVLKPGGLMVTQNGVPFFQAAELRGSMKHLRSLFSDATCYVAAIPTYIGGHMAMGWASTDKALRRHSAATIAGRYRKAGRFPTRYWTPDVHAAAFALPRFIDDIVAGRRS
jgi:spermidine synthase